MGIFDCFTLGGRPAARRVHAKAGTEAVDKILALPKIDTDVPEVYPLSLEKTSKKWHIHLPTQKAESREPDEPSELLSQKQRYCLCSKLSSYSSRNFVQVMPETQKTHIAESKLGKPFDVDKLGPCLPPDNEARLDTVSCVLEAAKDPDPALSESHPSAAYIAPPCIPSC